MGITALAQDPTIVTTQSCRLYLEEIDITVNVQAFQYITKYFRLF